MRIREWGDRIKSLSVPLCLAIIFGLMFFIPLKGINLREQESMMPIIAVGILLAGVLFTMNKSVGVLLAFLIASVVAHFNLASWSFIRNALVYAGLYIVIVAYYPKINKNMLYNTICVIALINVLWLILQSSGTYFLFIPRNATYNTGWFSNPNETSIFLAITVPCFLRKHWYEWLIAIAVGLMITTGSAACIAGMVVGIIFLIIKAKEKDKAIALAIVGVIFFGAIFLTKIDPITPQARLEAWGRGITLAKQKTWTGWAIGQTQYLLPLYFRPELLSKDSLNVLDKNLVYRKDFRTVFTNTHKKTNKEILERSIWTHLHNEFLEVWLEMGLIGVFLFGVVLFTHFRNYLKSKEKDIIPVLMIIAILIGAGAMYILHIGRFVFLLVICLALIQGEYSLQGVKKEVI